MFYSLFVLSSQAENRSFPDPCTTYVRVYVYVYYTHVYRHVYYTLPDRLGQPPLPDPAGPRGPRPGRPQLRPHVPQQQELAEERIQVQHV